MSIPVVKHKQYLTEDEYLEGEQFADVKHEYIDGRVYAMAGATSVHNLICLNMAGITKDSSKSKSCKTYVADVKIKVGTKYFYPDVMVDCSGEMHNKSLFSEKPSLIIEVLSDSTRKFDETTKFNAYKNIESLQEYVLIEQDFMKIQVHRRSDNWHSQAYYSGEEVRFESLGLALPIETLYDSIEFEEAEESDSSE